VWASTEELRTQVTAGPDQNLIPCSLLSPPQRLSHFQQWAGQVLLPVSLGCSAEI
ncbi:hypothetical protein NQZ68_005780, partial [Dissostichus eleginoides]